MSGQPKPLFYVAVAVVALGLASFAGYRIYRAINGEPPERAVGKQPGAGGGPNGDGARPRGSPPELSAKPIDPKVAEKIIPHEAQVPEVGAAGEYNMVDNTIDVEISDWPGYAGLIAANGGLEPSENSYFFRNHGFKVRIALSEAELEGWQRIHGGKTAASVTTVDVLSIYGPQLKVEVPLQLDYSRGGDGILTRKEIKSINQLKGKTVIVAQFTEVDFLIRFLAQEAGLGVQPLSSLDDRPDPARINLLFAETAEDAAEVFAHFVEQNDPRISGAVTWNPYTLEIPEKYPDKVHLLTSNRNLLVVADILIVNAAFAKANPKIVTGLVEGILQGVEDVKKNQAALLPVLARAFNTTPDAMRARLKDVHLSNHAENMLFFSSDGGQIGTFQEIYYSAVYAYGKDLIKNPAPPEKLTNRSYLERLANKFSGQEVALRPIQSAEKRETLENNPLFTKQIRFVFEPNSTDLDQNDPANQQALKDLSTLLKLFPGSYLVLRGHLDNSKVPEFKEKGEAFFRRQSVRAVEQSKQRAESVKAVLVRNYGLDEKRFDTEGRGWDEPLPGATADENRRVEVQVFTLE